MLSLNPNLTAAQIKTTLRATANKVGGVVYDINGFHVQYGYGRINAFAALSSLGMNVAGTTPVNGSTVSAPPVLVGGYTVDFNFPYDQSSASIDLSKFQVNGVSPTSFTVLDADTLQINFSDNPVTTQGIQTFTVDAGAVVRLSNSEPNGPYSGTFRYDAVALQVVSTTPVSPGGVFLLPAPFTYDVLFNEDVAAASVGTADLTLSTGTVTGAVRDATNFKLVHYTLSGITAEGALSITVNAGQLTDTFTNPNPAAFTGSYQVDIGTVAYPTPLAPKTPAGSLIYDPTISGIVNFAGDTDNFTLNIDPNQTISIIVTPTSPGLKPRVELFDPSNASLGFAAAPAAGQVAGIQTRATTTGGVYRIAVTGDASTAGGYTVRVILNAAFELEGLVAGATNNTTATAQEINGSFTSHDTTLAHARRGAALGTTDTAAGYTASAVPFGFTDITGTGANTGLSGDDSATTVGMPFSFSFYGVSYTSLGVSTNGLITFGGTDANYSNSSLASSPSLAAIAPFWDDLHVSNSTGTARVLTQTIGAVGSRQFIIQWDKISFFSSSGSSDTLTFQAILSEGTNTIRLNYLDLVSGTQGGNNGASATVGVKRANPTAGQFMDLALNNGPNAYVGTGQSTVITPAVASADYYSFTATAGQRVSLGVTNQTAGNVDVQLIAPNGTTVLASGVAGATNLNEAIQNFLIPATGTYFVRVAGDSTVPYSLFVTQDAVIDAEANETLGTAQDATGTQGALGAITPVSTYLVTAVPFTFEDISGTGTVIGGLTGADDSATTIPIGFTFPFYGTSQTTVGVSSNGLLTFGGTDSTFTNLDLTTSPNLAAIAPFWDDLHTAGGLANSNVFSQVIGTGVNQHLTIQWNNIRFFSGGTAGDTLTLQAQLFADGRIRFNYLDLVSGLAGGNNGASATVGIKAAGTQGPNRLLLAFNNGPNAFVGSGRSTLISQPPGEDWYKVTLGSGETVVEVETRTPADGSGEFVNTLNPMIQIFNARGTDITPSVTILGDGRNEKFRATGLTPGQTYFVKVSGEGNTVGEYFVGIKPLVTPTPKVTVDNTGFQFSTTAAWALTSGAGHGGSYRSKAGVPGGTSYAQWTYSLTFDGSPYDVYATWVPLPGNATDAKYSVSVDGGTATVVTVNQRLSPNTALVGGTLWQKLLTITPAAGFHVVRVRLLEDANGTVVADAVFDPPQAVRKSGTAARKNHKDDDRPRQRAEQLDRFFAALANEESERNKSRARRNALRA